MTSEELIAAFHKSPAGKVIAGKEAFRSSVGRVMHGMARKHPRLMMAVGAVALVSGAALGPTVLVAVSPVLFAGVYGAISPKKDEQAACEFLANVAVRKAAALYRFAKRQPDLSVEDSKVAVEKYLMQNMPLGMAKEYKSDHPDAVAQIMAGQEAEAYYHNPAVYKLEAIQEQFTKNQDKGGILHGMMQVFTAKYKEQVATASKIATSRWEDRKIWERSPSGKLNWISFMHSRQYEKETGRPSIMGALAESKMKSNRMPNVSVRQQPIQRPTEKSNKTVRRVPISRGCYE